MTNIYKSSSFYIHLSTAFLLIISVFLLAKDFSNIQSRNTYDTVMLLLIFAQVLAIHGISHLGLENLYKYNPLLDLFRKKDEKID